MKAKTLALLASSLLLASSATVMADDIIPYPNSGFVNPVTYTFKAAATGNITAYFVGGGGLGGALYDNELGLLVNGVSTNVIGLDNQTSSVGDSLNLGSVQMGDTLVFVMQNNSLSGEDVYSDPALNGSYDGGIGINHIYSTAYTMTPPIGSITDGTYVAFEDQPAKYNPDYNYNDEAFVFTNVASVSSAAPLPSTAWSGLAIMAGMIGAFSIRRRRLSAI